MNPGVACPVPSCRNHKSPKAMAIKLNGTYFRKRDGRNITQFYCPLCGKTFSEATFETTYRQHRPDINEAVRHHLMSGTSARRTARLLGVNPKTIAARVRFLADMAYKDHWMRVSREPKRRFIQTDEMESFEHTKLKPVSIPLVVDGGTREILDVDVAVMPAKGLLAAPSRAKYGPRRDDRVPVMSRMMHRVAALVVRDVTVRSDMCPRYPFIIKTALPVAKHEVSRSRRGCVVGYGELKATGKDPLFSLNHTAAMVRDNLKRMSRRTWCTTKRMDRLRDMLWIYVDYHNTELIHPQTKATGTLKAA